MESTTDYDTKKCLVTRYLTHAVSTWCSIKDRYNGQPTPCPQQVLPAKFMLVRVKSREDLQESFDTGVWHISSHKHLPIFNHVIKDTYYLATRYNTLPDDVPIYLFFTVKGSGNIEALARISENAILNTQKLAVKWLIKEGQPLDLSTLSCIEYDKANRDYMGANVLTIGH